ncbi:MAG: putative toxin-antitoxin system toxin component, PIN family [Candidatus Doudnabacteria bacterium]
MSFYFFMLKVVIDTNLLIDGSEDFYNFGNRIIDLAISGNIEAYANKATLRENQFLAEKKIHDEGYLKKLKYFFDAVKPAESSAHLKVVEDSEDDKILESAVSAGVDYLITSDHHLLKLGKFRGVRIVRPGAFWQIWEDEGEGWKKWINSFLK